MKHVDTNSIKHFSVCFILSLFGLYGVSTAIGASLTKEYYDKKTYGHWCWIDLLFDALGCAAGYGIHYLIFK